MKKIIYLLGIILSLFYSDLKAQKLKANPFQRVEISDSISIKLEKAYEKNTGFNNVNASRNVWNLIYNDDFIFKNGLYSFKGQGPHFPRQIFIYNNYKLYVFASSSTEKVLAEYLECIKLLALSEEDEIIYLKGISQYLQDEFGEIYGAEIRK